MSQIHIVFAGPPEQRHTLKASPMTLLRALLQEACAKVRPALDPAGHTLVLGKKPVDLDLPFRLANIPAGSRLDLVPGSSPPSGSASSSHGHVQRPAGQQAQTGASSSTGDAGTSGPSASAIAAETAPAAPPEVFPLGADRHFVLCTQQALESAVEAALGHPSTEDPPDEFYDFTEADLQAVMYKSNERQKDGGRLKTAAVREAEAQARAQSYGPVPVRVHLPGGDVLQATFAATETLLKLRDLVACVVAPELRSSGAFFLYTTPPRQVLKELDKTTFFSAQLVPAAHVYAHVDEKKAAGYDGPFLSADASALVQRQVDSDTAAAIASSRRKRDDGKAGPGTASDGAAGAPAATSGAAEGSASGVAAAQSTGPLNYSYGTQAPGAKVPKWLKLGQK